jgi:hypothetical protein
MNSLERGAEHSWIMRNSPAALVDAFCQADFNAQPISHSYQIQWRESRRPLAAASCSRIIAVRPFGRSRSPQRGSLIPLSSLIRLAM